MKALHYLVTIITVLTQTGCGPDNVTIATQEANTLVKTYWQDQAELYRGFMEAEDNLIKEHLDPALDHEKSIEISLGCLSFLEKRDLIQQKVKMSSEELEKRAHLDLAVIEAKYKVKFNILEE